MAKLALLLVLALSYALAKEPTRLQYRRYQKYAKASEGTQSISGVALQTAIPRGSVTIDAVAGTTVTVTENDDVSYSCDISALGANKGITVTWDSSSFDFALGWSRETDGDVPSAYSSNSGTTLSVPACGVVGHTMLYLQIQYFPSTNDPSSAAVTFNVMSYSQVCEEFAINSLAPVAGNITGGLPRFYKLTYSPSFGQMLSISTNSFVDVEASANPLVYPATSFSSTTTVLALNHQNTIVISLASSSDDMYNLTFDITPYNCSTRLSYGTECGDTAPATAVCVSPLCPKTANYSNALIDPFAEFGLAILYAFGSVFLPHGCLLATMDAACISAYAPCDANNLLLPVCALPYCNKLTSKCSGSPTLTPTQCLETLESDPDSPNSVIPYSTAAVNPATLNNSNPNAPCVYWSASGGMRNSAGVPLLVALIAFLVAIM